MRNKIEYHYDGKDFGDVRKTFLSLTEKTYPHGHEEEVLGLLPELMNDQFGNYYRIIGDRPTTMFTSHLDTADHRQNKTERYSTIDNGVENITTGGESILGADDKAGVTVMLYMIEKNVPGLYYFFIGEERGGIGSKKLANDFEQVEYVKDIVRCVSFDRRGTGSIITKQLGRQCCSDEFANALCDQYNSLGMNMSPDPTGIFTDSAMLMGNIPECTNVSVGYMNEHTGKEVQNITHLEKLCKVSCEVDWDSLPTKRDLQEAVHGDKDYPDSYKDLVKDAKKIETFSGIEEDEDGEWSLYFDIEGWKPSEVLSELKDINQLVEKHNLVDVCHMGNGYLIIQIVQL
jgi:hypothetical protein